MRGSFPTSLQRTSDERWVTLDLVSHDERRALARVCDVPEVAAVVRSGTDIDYDAHLRRLLSTPPPDAGPGVRISWPVDLLHDLDAVAVGYVVQRIAAPASFGLAEFLDPVRRAEIAPLATHRHLLRVARNVATALAALHHAGHGGLRTRHLRVDDRARIIVVRTDELRPDVPEVVRSEDLGWLGRLVLGLLDGQPGVREGTLGSLLARVSDRGTSPPTAEEWFHALRAAEASLSARPDVRGAAVPGRRIELDPPEIRTATTPARTRRTAPDPRGRHTTAGRARTRRRRGEDGEPGRAAFAVAVGLAAGAVASVAPFLTFMAASLVIIARAAVRAGRRDGTVGRAQAAAITMTRLLPFATGGLALAAFVLFDLLLLLGLAMAIAERLFSYGPGFTLTWVLDLPQVPGLVRAFAFAVGAIAGVNVGGDLHDGLRRSARPRGRRIRRIATPALAGAVALGVILRDAGIVWWPFATT